MIPPCDPSILDHNPQFQRLYENLTSNLLNPDGSTRAQVDPARRAIEEELKTCQMKTAKKRIKERTLKQLAFAANSELQEECHDNLAIISIYLETPCAAIEPETCAQSNPITSQEDGPKQDDALTLLSQDFETFYSSIPKFILQFSNILSTSIHDLRSIASVPTDPLAAVAESEATVSRTLPGLTRSTSNHYSRTRARDRRVRTSMAPLPPLASQLRDRVHVLRRIQVSDLPSARRQMTVTAAEVLAVRTQILERAVEILERAKHGALARATRAKAEHLAIVSQGVESKLEVTKLEIAAKLYTPETLSALTRYKQHLSETRVRLDERREMAIEELKRYGGADDGSADSTDVERNRDVESGTLAEIARRYGVLAKEVEDVKMEIARLGE
ncbi:uncharacterized protein N7483_008706 [Penicillium malachiteum]|uniref:uncharacterized protein n=1 Tax=Penicillium malachiteum TaxID=1324776 RepID=UPI002547C905|nr:uncharacterized protein N7483_008706 [Penicillium malachiteum]KAJ5720772.1 hypothetical protein N7483_008706 [Penicillium malachiteum]